jgi:hypothetical protein
MQTFEVDSVLAPQGRSWRPLRTVSGHCRAKQIRRRSRPKIATECPHGGRSDSALRFFRRLLKLREKPDTLSRKRATRNSSTFRPRLAVSPRGFFARTASAWQVHAPTRHFHDPHDVAGSWSTPLCAWSDRGALSHVRASPTNDRSTHLAGTRVLRKSCADVLRPKLGAPQADGTREQSRAKSRREHPARDQAARDQAAPRLPTIVDIGRTTLAGQDESVTVSS